MELTLKFLNFKNWNRDCVACWTETVSLPPSFSEDSLLWHVDSSEAKSGCSKTHQPRWRWFCQPVRTSHLPCISYCRKSEKCLARSLGRFVFICMFYVDWYMNLSQPCMLRCKCNVISYYSAYIILCFVSIYMAWYVYLSCNSNSVKMIIILSSLPSFLLSSHAICGPPVWHARHTWFPEWATNNTKYNVPGFLSARFNVWFEASFPWSILYR